MIVLNIVQGSNPLECLWGILLDDNSPFKIKSTEVFLVYLNFIFVFFGGKPTINLSIILGKSSFNTTSGIVDFKIIKLIQVFDLLIIHAVNVLVIVVHILISNTCSSFTFSHCFDLRDLVGLFLQANALFFIPKLLDDSVEGCVDDFQRQGFVEVLLEISLVALKSLDTVLEILFVSRD